MKLPTNLNLTQKTAKIIALGLLFTFAFLQILLHFLDPSVGFKTEFVSNFALGQFGFLFFLSLTFLSIAKLFLSWLVGLSATQKRLSKWIQTFIILSALFNFLIAVFETDAGPNSTLTGTLHLIFAYTSFIATAVFLFLFTAFQPQKQTTIFVAKLTIASLYFLTLASFPFVAGELKPIIERALIFFLSLGIGLNIILVNKENSSKN